MGRDMVFNLNLVLFRVGAEPDARPFFLCLMFVCDSRQQQRYDGKVRKDEEEKQKGNPCFSGEGRLFTRPDPGGRAGNNAFVRELSDGT